MEPTSSGSTENRTPTHGYEATREAAMAGQVARRKGIVDGLVLVSRR